MSRESRWCPLPLPPLFFAERGRGVGGERGAGAATNTARQARPAQRAVRRTKKEGRAGSGVAWRGVVLLWRQVPPLLLWPMIAARRKAQSPASAPRACTKVHARVLTSPWQPRATISAAGSEAGAPLLLAEGGGGSPTEGVEKSKVP
jgi:hypothetical protein